MHAPFNFQQHWRVATASTAATLLAAGLAAWVIIRRRPTAAQIEERRRQRLASAGRIIDGVLTGAEPDTEAPQAVFYTYRVAGVRYECSQDISALTEQVRKVYLDAPVQVRYAPAHPGNSIVLAETWNGLWTSEGYKREA